MRCYTFQSFIYIFAIVTCISIPPDTAMGGDIDEVTPDKQRILLQNSFWRNSKNMPIPAPHANTDQIVEISNKRSKTQIEQLIAVFEVDPISAFAKKEARFLSDLKKKQWLESPAGMAAADLLKSERKYLLRQVFRIDIGTFSDFYQYDIKNKSFEFNPLYSMSVFARKDLAPSYIRFPTFDKYFRKASSQSTARWFFPANEKMAMSLESSNAKLTIYFKLSGKLKKVSHNLPGNRPSSIFRKYPVAIKPVLTVVDSEDQTVLYEFSK